LIYMTNRHKHDDSNSDANHHLEMQDIMMNLAAKFINLDLQEIDTAIQQSLADIGCFVDADRAYIFEFNKTLRQVRNTFEWCYEGISSHKDDLQNVSVDIIIDWYKEHLKENAIIIEDVNELPNNTAQKAVLQIQGIQSVVAFPMIMNNKYMGFVGFDSVRKKHLYTDKEVQILNVFAQMLVNIEQRKSMQKHLVESRNEADRANKAKSIFLANMSHEIRTPLNGVIGFLDMLKHTEPTEEQLGYIENATKSAVNLMNIINDILDLSKIEAEKLKLEEVETDLYELVNESVNLLKHSALKKGLFMDVFIDEKVPQFVVVDPLRLKQILINLVGNAVKFTETGGITFRLSFEKQKSAIKRKTGKFTFEIEDTGIGISDDKKGELFKAFSQVDTSVKRKYGGTGLGLIISNNLARKMGSEIKLESKPNEGSLFYFTLKKPFKTSTEVNKKIRYGSDNNTEIEPDALSEPKILIAEDTELNRLLVRAVLKKFYPKAKVTEAVNGRDAVIHYLNEKPDIIFMDIQMPVLSGFEAVKEIREIEKSDRIRSTPIVAITASVTSDAKERCISAGMDDYISKPFRDYQIYEVVKRYALNKN